MTLRVLALLLIGALATSSVEAHSATTVAAVPKTFTGKVTRVLDGDSLEVRYRNVLVPVQLFAIDAPELNQPFGKIAKEYVEVASRGKSVIVYAQQVVGNSLLAIVRVNGKGVLNELLLNEGIAWFDRSQGRSIRLPKMEANARRKKRGLWSLKDPVSPWTWRDRQRKTI